MLDSTRQSLIVTLSGERPLESMVAELQAAGLVVEQTFELIGSISGSAPAHRVDALRRLQGVADVSVDQAVDIGPPGATVS